jgi:uncharacterized protein (TIGR00730 family)
MPERLPRYRTGNRDLDRRIVELLDAVGATSNRDQLFEILATGVRLAADDTDRLDLKIANAALKEMRHAFRLFAPYQGIRKVTMFGSARTLPDDPLYAQARSFASAIAAEGWMVVTGAGPGIMAAGLEGAGRKMSFGINIRLPFEQGPSPFIGGDAKLIEMKYFFTRKLALMKESSGFIVLPGGFGTLDECLELLTLIQTGKAEPAPIVCLEVPGGTYWHTWWRFMTDEVLSAGLISEDDMHLVSITDNVAAAVNELTTFYRNYSSLRYVGDLLVFRLNYAPTPAELDELSEEFADICVEGGIETTAPLPAEVADNDELDLPRVLLQFDRRQHGRLREFIDALNRLSSVPPVPSMPPE